MFSTISALGIAWQHSKVSHDSNNSKSQDITKFGHFGVPKTTLMKEKITQIHTVKPVNSTSLGTKKKQQQNSAICSDVLFRGTLS
jgi:hypothetical protein